MTLILRPQWTRQPQGLLALDRGSPLSNRLESVVWGRFYVDQRSSGSLSVAVGAPTISVGSAGVGARFAGGRTAFSAGSIGAIPSTEGFTVEVLCAITAAPSLAGFVSTSVTGTTGQARGLIAFGGGSNRNIYFWGDSADLASGVDWRIDGSLQHVFVTSDGGAGTPMRFYRDGVQIASGTTPAITTRSASFPLRIGDVDKAWDSTPTGTIFKAAYYRRALTPSEVAQLSVNPWQLFQPRRIWVPAGVAGGGVSGTSSTTNAADTSSASGTTTVVGTLARTNAADTSSASGTTTVTGTVARTNANDTSAASGTTTVTGTVARTNANDTSSASGTVGSAGVSGSVAYTNAADTSLASGTTTVVGSAAVTAANDTSAASGTTAIVGTVAYTNANDTSAATDVESISVVQPYLVVRFWKRTA